MWFGIFKSLSKFVTCAYLFDLERKLGDFIYNGDGTDHSHIAPVLKTMWPGATIIQGAIIKHFTC